MPVWRDNDRGGRTGNKVKSPPPPAFCNIRFAITRHQEGDSGMDTTAGKLKELKEKEKKMREMGG
ncbi:MAG: hypothetical protein ACOC3F_01950, partial [Desulfosudaceae bacterium]